MLVSEVNVPPNLPKNSKFGGTFQTFQTETKTSKAIRTVLITTKGLAQGEHSDDFTKVLTINNLFIENIEEG